MNKLLTAIVFVVFLLNACTPVVSIPTAPAGSRLVFGLSDGRTVDGPVWSPTGRELAFTTFSPDNGKGQIYILDFSTHNVQALGNLIYVDALSWSPDGKYMVYHSLGEMYIIPVDGSAGSKLVSSGQVAAYSPDGKHLAIFDNAGTASRSTYLLRLLDLETATEKEMFSVNAGNLFISDLSWSPDGMKLAFSLPAKKQVSGKLRQDIYIFDLEKEELLPFTFSEANFSPTWSPDGRQIAYLHQQAGASSISIIISQADGSCEVIVPGVDNAHSLAWSPDGLYLAYSQVTGIYLLNLLSVYGDEFVDAGPKCP